MAPTTRTAMLVDGRSQDSFRAMHLRVVGAISRHRGAGDFTKGTADITAIPAQWTVRA